MRTIIVATSFSKKANNTTIYASNFAAETGARIILFHLYHVSIHALNARVDSLTMDELYADSKKRLSDMAKKISEEYKIEVQPVWKMGDFQEELQNTIDETKADIVVMGMIEDSIEENLFGNTTTAALQTFKFPILAIPPHATYKGLSTILLAFDISRGVHNKILNKIKEIALRFGATIEVFYVRKKIDELENEQKEINVPEHFAEELDGTNYYHKNVISNTIIEAIQKEITQINADLLIMIPYKYGFWDSWLHKSKTRIMASKSEIPLLSIPL